MKKLKIAESSDEVVNINLFNKKEENTNNMKEVESVKAIGTGILVELLTPDEAFGSSLYIPNNTKMPAIQGTIIDVGPALNRQEWGIELGDRVVLWGEFVEVPKPKTANQNTNKRWGIFPPHAIKAVLK